MRALDLIPHPDTPPRAVRSIRVEVIDTPHDLLVNYVISGAESVLLPKWETPQRTDELWKTTCFELFLQPEGRDEYFEFNFSPSSRWAAYEFDAPRVGMRDMPLIASPLIDLVERQDAYRIEVDLGLDPIIPNGTLRVGLSAVIEETDGTKSYWALAHAPGPPDFHNPACFTATLPAPRYP